MKRGLPTFKIFVLSLVMVIIIINGIDKASGLQCYACKSTNIKEEDNPCHSGNLTSGSVVECSSGFCSSHSFQRPNVVTILKGCGVTKDGGKCVKEVVSIIDGQSSSKSNENETKTSAIQIFHRNGVKEANEVVDILEKCLESKGIVSYDREYLPKGADKTSDTVTIQVCNKDMCNADPMIFEDLKKLKKPVKCYKCQGKSCRTVSSITPTVTCYSGYCTYHRITKGDVSRGCGGDNHGKCAKIHGDNLGCVSDEKKAQQKGFLGCAKKDLVDAEVGNGEPWTLPSYHSDDGTWCTCNTELCNGAGRNDYLLSLLLSFSVIILMTVHSF